MKSQKGNRGAAPSAVSAGWQEQINAQRTEHDRLMEQNKGLMEQINQYQASNRDAKNRAKELSAAVQEAYGRRDQLQRDLKDIRSNLEVAMTERDQLQSDISEKDVSSGALAEKDERISKLQIELENWQNRLPPLIEKFRQRNEQAVQLEADLDAAKERIAQLEVGSNENENEPEQTRIEPVSDPDNLTNGRDASNDADEMACESEHIAEEDEGSNDPVNVERDKLQAIKGVGPAIEKTLNEMGVFSFQQIADMSEYDIDRIAKRLKGFRSRIYREDWIGQARELREQTQSG